MQFRVFYEGHLKANADNPTKWSIRGQLEPQFRQLWQQAPLAGIAKYQDPTYQPRDCYVGVQRGAIECVPIVSTKLRVRAELDILLLTSTPPGEIIGAGGDLDNRLKTLLDALTIPDPNQKPPTSFAPQPDNRVYCLLEDDKLVTRLTVETDRLLSIPERDPKVVAVIGVNIKAVEGIMANIGIAL
jgi:hypothetical protein